jgi:hypothetical protein
MHHAKKRPGSRRLFACPKRPKSAKLELRKLSSIAGKNKARSSFPKEALWLANVAMGADLQRPDDHRRGHRALGASQRHHRVEHPQLPFGDRQKHTETFRRANPSARRPLIAAKSHIPPGILIVAKEEI